MLERFAPASRSSRRRASAALVCALVASCSGAESPEAGPRAVDSLEVDYGHCLAVRHAEVPTCVLESDSLRLWLRHPDAEHATVYVDGVDIEPSQFRHEELVGLGLRLTLPESARHLKVEIDTASGAPTAWELELSHDDPNPLFASVRTAIDKDLQKGDTAAAIARLDDVRIAYPNTTETLDVAFAAVFWLARDVNALPLAETLLDDYAPLARKSPQGRAELAINRGLLHWYRGRLDQAAMAYREAAQYALRSEDSYRQMATIPMYADMLAELGYLGAAMHWVRHTERRLDKGSNSPEVIGSVSRTLGWIGLLLNAAGRDESDPGPHLYEALEIFGPRGAAPRPKKVGGVRLGLARLALDRARPGEALAQLEQIDPKKITPDEYSHAVELEIRARLEGGESTPEIEALIEEYEDIASRSHTPQVAWTAAVIRGRLAEVEGRVDDAIEHYRDAEALRDEVLTLTVFGAGRSNAGALDPEATERLVTLLLDRGRAEEALCTARLAQARTVQTLVMPSSLSRGERRDIEEQTLAYIGLGQQIHDLERSGRERSGERLERVRREATQLRRELQRQATALTLARAQLSGGLECSDLTPRQPGELIVALYPQGPDWVMFVLDDGALTVHPLATSGRLSSLPTEQQAALLVDPIADRLRAASRVRVLATGDANHVDVHALGLDGQPLVARLPVHYAAELPSSTASSAVSSDRRHALLLADPTRSLWAASSEVRTAGGLLSEAGWSTSQPSDPGSLLQVIEELETADLFHHAGHADAATPTNVASLWPPYQGGAPGWPSYLQLEPPVQLAVHEILLLSHAPRHVVLNACRSGVVDVQHAGTSLALAFLAAGSEQVLASPEATEDLLDAELGQRLYEGLTPGEPLDLAVQLHRLMARRVAAGDSVGRLRVWSR
ncbi:MAG: CHAT domain-containing protein [Myxococcota bacterium]